MTNAVFFQGVTKNFGAVRAVDGLDLRVDRGEMVALLGANGAGKSTSVNMLLGLRAPTAGQVSGLGGRPAEAVPAARTGPMRRARGLMPGLNEGGGGHRGGRRA